MEISVLRFDILCCFVLFLSVLFAETAGQIKTEYKGDSMVVEGDPFIISCRVSQYGTVKWQKDGRNLYNGSNSYIWYDSTDDGAISSLLSVPYARTFHSGSYRCDTLSSESHHLFVVSATDVQVDYDYENYKILQLKKRFSINCTIVDAPQASIKWTKDGKELNPKDGYSTVDKPPSFLVVVEKPTDEHTGNYTCQAYHNTTLLKTKEIIVVSQPTASMNADTIVVEEEKLTLDCQPTGKPTPQVTWIIAGNIVLNGSSADSSHIQQLPSNDVPNGKLRINSAMMSDRGEYKCIVSNIVTTNMNGTEASAVTLVRVKDKLAALWPFLGICAEVFVLCAIILIYEKKRNKAELEESDTDNSPEQKNTPDHGKDSVRQRK